VKSTNLRRLSQETLLPLLLMLFVVPVAAPIGAEEPAPPPPEEAEELKNIFSFGLELLGESDSNVNLGADKVFWNEAPCESDPTQTCLVEDRSELAQDDIVYRARPNFRASIPVGEHLFGVDAAADFRRGTDSNLSEGNGSVSGFADLRFDGGLGLRVSDTWGRVAFDQALYFDNPALGEPGISKSETNNGGVLLSYQPRERFLVEAGFERRDEAFDFAATAFDPVTGRPNGFTTAHDERTLETYSGRLVLPVTKEFETYVSARKLDQGAKTESRDPRTYTYTDNRIVTGIRWVPSEKLSAFVEGGLEETDFADAEGVEYDRGVWLTGLEATFGEQTLLRASFGKDGYGNTVYQLLCDRTLPESSALIVMLQKSSQNSFSSGTVSRIFEATILTVRAERTFATRLTLGFEASGFLLEAETASKKQRDKTLLGRLFAGWKLTDWLRIGVHAQRADRSSKEARNEFEDSRIGLSLTFSR
jgi:hypothetical protein